MKRKHGFTLVELLVVIGIIALLIAILLPALAKAQLASKNVKCLANLHALGQGFNLYAGQYNNTWPTPGKLQPAPETYWQRNFIYKTLYSKDPVADLNVPSPEHEYIANTVFQCPAAVEYSPQPIGPSGVSYGMTVLSYGMNARLNDTNGSGKNSRAVFKKPNLVAKSSSTCLLVDNTAPWSGVNINVTSPFTASDPDDQVHRLQVASLRHHLKLNFLFCDAHAETLNYADVPKDPTSQTWYGFWAGAR